MQIRLPRLLLVLAALSGAVSAQAAQTVVSLTFDDATSGQALAGEILRQRGLKGTFYVNTDRIGAGGFLTRAQLDVLAADGHEVTGHTLTHADLTLVSAAEAERQVCDDRQQLLAWGFDPKSFAYPFGANNAGVRSVVAACGYSNARAVGGLSCVGCAKAEPFPPPEPFAIRSAESIKSTTTLAQLQGYVSAVEAAGGGWVPLVFHYICDGCEDLSVSSRTLIDFTDWLAARSAQGTVVETVVQAMSRGLASTTTASLWAPSLGPAAAEFSNDPAPVSLGVRFRSDVAGRIDGIRYYKTGATGPHVGRLYTNAGALLGSVNFTGESASGWQTALFPAPIPIAASTTYVASYHSQSGFAVTRDYFLAPRDNAPLHAPASAPGALNGLYLYGAAPAFPTASTRASNYWVDVVFSVAGSTPPLPPPPSSTATATLWTTQGPANNEFYLDPNPLTLGVRFFSDVPGVVTGVRFFKVSGNDGPHAARLYTSTGGLLGSAPFANETSTGWQTTAFPAPIAVASNTVYVAAYHSPTGYAATRDYFTVPRDSPPLHAPATAPGALNGRYVYGAAPAFPVNGFQATNYWVDAVFFQNASTVPAPNPTCFSSAGTWQNRPFTSQTDSFEATFDATPGQAGMDGVGGFSNGPASDYPAVASIVRFNPAGFIDARNGGAYAAAASIPYSAGTAYSFRLAVNVPAHTYSAFVRSGAGSEQLVGNNFAFRTEQGAVAALNNLGLFAATGSETVCNLAISTGPGGSPSLAAISVTPSSAAVMVGMRQAFRAIGTYTDGSTLTLSGPWSGLAPLPSGRRDLQGAASGGVLYAIGGYVASDTTTVEAYAPSADSWSTKAPLNAPNSTVSSPTPGANRGRYQGSAAAVGGKIYMIGGWTTSPALPSDTVSVYDPALNSWSAGPTVPERSACSQAAVIGTKIYLLSACNGFAGFKRSLYIFDTVAQTWTAGPDAPRPHAGGVGTAIAGKFYVTGGQDVVVRPEVDVYDPGTNAWTTGASMPAVLSAMAGDVINGKWYLAGGMDGASQPVNALWVYDPAANVWAPGPPMPTARGGPAAAAIAGKLYVAGGTDPTGNGSALEVFDPSPTGVGWSSDAPSVATVTAYGFATGLAGGSARIIASSGSVSGSAPLSVTAPSITGLSPNSATAGGPGFTLTVNGGNFTPDSVVRWNGSSRPKTFISGSTLTASISSGDVASTGTASVTVFNPVPGGEGGVSNAAAFTVFAASAPPPASSTATASLWTTQGPANDEFYLDPNPLTLGVRFFSDVPGVVKGVRFFKVSGNNGPHTARLYTSTGGLLGSAPFSNETSTGWQTTSFPVPIAVASNTVYVAAYHSPTGYAATRNYFTIPRESPPLHAPANAPGALNGRYVYGAAPAFPVNGFQATNYWVDAVFSQDVSTVPAPNPTCFSSAGSWQNRPFSPQAGSFEATFDATPGQAGMDGVAGFSNGPAADYPAVASIVRFNPAGFIDARNGGAYAAAAPIPYSAGTAYRFRLAVDVPAHTYSAFVRTGASPEQLVGGNFAFRTEQGAVGTLDNLGLFAATGSETACNLAISTQPAAAPGAREWAATGPMPAVRQSHTMTRLPDGRVLVTGGGSDPTNTAEVYDPATGSFTVTGFMADQRYGHSAALLPNGKVLVFGGGNSDGFNVSAELFDPALGTFSPTGSMSALRGLGALLPNGKVLAVAGDGSAQLYDPATGVWGPTGSRAGGGAVSFTLLQNGKVLAAGGELSELYDPAAGTWSDTGSMGAARTGHSATLLADGRVLVSGGRPAAGAELYDPATGLWSATGPMALNRWRHEATLLPEGLVLAAGGENESGTGLSSAELYDPANGTWRPAAHMTTQRGAHRALLLADGRVLATGGRADEYLSSAELYVPCSGPCPVQNPVPVVYPPSGFAPRAAAEAGGPGFTLHVRGGRFVPGAAVRWNGSPRATTFLDEGGLNAEIPASDIAAAQTVRVTVFNPAPGGGESNELLFTVKPTFTPGVVIFSETFTRPNGLITNEYATNNPNDPASVKSDVWKVRVGSLFANGNQGWTGVNDDVRPNAGSTNGTGNDFIRLQTQRGDFGEVAVQLNVVNHGMPRAVFRDGLRVLLRVTPTTDYYFLQFNDNTGGIGIGKVVDGAQTYLLLASNDPIPFGSTQTVRARAVNLADGSVELTLDAYGKTWSLVDWGNFGRVLRDPGAVGLRGDHTEFSFDDFTVYAPDGSDLGPSPSPSPSSTATASLWTTQGPASNEFYLDPNPLTLGVRFFADVPGFVTGVRFFKVSGNNGPHTARLYTSTGGLLGSAPFANETSTGWQTTAFPAPIAVASNTVYVAAYHSPTGYAATRNYFTVPRESPPLHAPANAPGALNGRYVYGAAPAFPVNGYQATNYWVDAVFSQGVSTAPAGGGAGLSAFAPDPKARQEGAFPAVADPGFGFKAAYIFPNPVRGVKAATFRLQPGLAGGADVRVYDLTGRLVHSSSEFTDRGAFDDGNGLGPQFTYEHLWDVSGIGSGVYFYVVAARKDGQTETRTGKLAIVK
ncbi:MAG: DUF4082 domain-containing protein [Elusimicrobia bacterium]|nr:DUF4082 domain-containing protein [Elusimicrobiota bacterium]